jgi:PBP1b-binding outer membrane lipoprotein LpoB
MKLHSAIFLLMGFLLFSGCTQKIEDSAAAEKTPTEAETRAADKASLLAAAKEAGVSEAEALAAKAEIDKVYDDTSARMSEAEAERNARMKQLKDEACIDNCSDQ